MTLKEKYWEDGYVFQFREGKRRMVYKDKLINRQGYIPKNIMSDNLVNIDSVIHDEVVAIYEPTDKVDYLDGFIKGGPCVWRKSEYMMTIDDIKERLGIPFDEQLIIIK